jgi:hypothetical protein
MFDGVIHLQGTKNERVSLLSATIDQRPPNNREGRGYLEDGRAHGVEVLLLLQTDGLLQHLLWLSSLQS